ncbi:MAG: flagellar basal body-associated FliL family protein [Sedimentisphaerales bacterium]|nr:flagellar basal body-associated FliL family protein [Sedimentisphaerales bacterium]
MADTDDTKKQDSKEETKAEKGEKKSLIGRMLPVVIIIVVVGISAGAGLGLGRLLAGPSEMPESEPKAVDSAKTDDAKSDEDSEDSSGDVWYYDLEPVVANLNEPSVARYISLSITLQISSELSKKDGTALLEEYKPILTDWLTVYLAGLALDDIRGDKNLKSVQSQIREGFNDKLFPDSKPRIKHILFRNFAVQ